MIKKIIYFIFLLFANQIVNSQVTKNSIKSFEKNFQTLNFKTSIYSEDSSYTKNNSHEIAISRKDLSKIKGIKVELIDSVNYFNLMTIEFLMVYDKEPTKEFISKSNEFTKEQRKVLSELLDFKFVHFERIKVKMKDGSWVRLAPIILKIY